METTAPRVNPITHHVGGDKLAGVSLPKGPAVREVGDSEPERHVVGVVVTPASARVVYVLHESLVVVVVEGVTVDVPEHVPHILHIDGLLRGDAFEFAALDPEPLNSAIIAERSIVEPLEGPVGGDENIPLDDGQGVVVHEIRSDLFVEKHLVEHGGRTRLMNVLLLRMFQFRSVHNSRRDHHVISRTHLCKHQETSDTSVCDAARTARRCRISRVVQLEACLETTGEGAQYRRREIPRTNPGMYV